MTFIQRRNRLTTHFSERIPVVKRRVSVFCNMRLTHIIVANNMAHKMVATFKSVFLCLLACCCSFNDVSNKTDKD
jgi:uncharacterized membrane protein